MAVVRGGVGDGQRVGGVRVVWNYFKVVDIQISWYQGIGKVYSQSQIMHPMTS